MGNLGLNSLQGRVVARAGLFLAIAICAVVISLPSYAEHNYDCPNPKGWNPDEEKLKKILNDHQNWAYEYIDRPAASQEGRANLCNAVLENRDLRGYTILGRLNLHNAVLSGANLRDANLMWADLSSASLVGADLRNALLQGADLSGADIQDAKLSGADLTDAKYEPTSAPATGHLWGLRGLASTRFDPGQYSGLVLLRAALRQAGLRDLERDATFAIEHSKTRHSLSGLHSVLDPGRSGIPVPPKFTNRVDGAFKLVFFEWTTGYGLYYGRPLFILIVLIGLMTLVYIVPIAFTGRVGKGSGIFKIWPRGRIEEASAGFESAAEEKVEQLSAKGLPVLGYAFYFSVLSAFHIGWRELNVGTWLTRLQSREFALRARGWVRIVSGAQSLVSVYMLAMWALTYFGRPFQ